MSYVNNLKFSLFGYFKLSNALNISEIRRINCIGSLLRPLPKNAYAGSECSGQTQTSSKKVPTKENRCAS